MSRTVSVVNPSFKDINDIQDNENNSNNNNNKPTSKFLLAGMGFAAVAVGFAVGFLANNPSSAASAKDSEDVVGNTDAALEASLASFVAETPDLTKMSATDIMEVVSAYNADPAAFQDSFIPTGFAAILGEAAIQETAVDPPTRRRLGANSVLDNYRDLADATPLGRETFKVINEDDYSGSIVTRDDQIKIFKTDNNICYIISEFSDSIEDWINNIDLGTEDILSVGTSEQRVSACGCERTRLWWCQTYRSCQQPRVLGRGYDGFSKTWNEVRVRVKQQLDSKCAGASEYRFAGASRGAAIMAVGAFAAWKEGLVPRDRIKLITYGSPRALVDASSDEVHNQFVTERHVYNNDPVPSFPFSFWGFSHFGTHICKYCTEGRNRPFVPNLLAVLDHGGYFIWFA